MRAKENEFLFFVNIFLKKFLIAFYLYWNRYNLADGQFSLYTSSSVSYTVHINTFSSQGRKLYYDINSHTNNI